MERISIPMNFNWQYLPRFEEAYLEADSLDDAKIVSLPHTNIELPFNNFSETDYQFISTYCKSFILTKEDKGKKILLEMEGVMSSCTVYCNHKKAGSHLGGYTSFQIDLSPYVIIDGNNVLMVIVDSREQQNIPPFGNVIDYLTYGGIYREIRLLKVNPIHFQHILISPIQNNTKIEVKFFLNDVCDQFQLQVEVFDEEQCSVVEKKLLFITTKAGKFNLDIPKTKLWSLKHPHLYTLKATLLNHQEVAIDYMEQRFGMRSVKVNNQGFFLNGELIKLRGLNRHQSYPYVGYAMPQSMQYLDAKILKQDLSNNIVRTSHYPQSRHFLDACDELGLLVFTEIPGWQYLGDDAWQKVLLQNTEEMVLEQFNHPSVVIWGVRVDESIDHHELYLLTNEMVRKYDPYRPTSGVRNFSKSELLEDIYSYNDFIHDGTNEGIAKKSSITKSDVPYLITEHNGHMYPTKKNDPESTRLSQALRHARVINDTNKAMDVAGCIGWCMADYNTHEQFGSGDHICYHGVLDQFRIPKTAASVYASQQNHTPFLELSSTLCSGDYPRMVLSPIYAFTNCDSIDCYKNETLIGRFIKDSEDFNAMFNPPILIDDFIGKQIEQNERYHEKDARRIKRILQRVASEGMDHLSLLEKFWMAKVFIQYHMSYHEAESLFLKYFTNLQSDNPLRYFRFIGYRDGVPVIEKKVGPTHLDSLVVSSDCYHLYEEETYDVSRYVLEAKDTFGNTMAYCNDAITITIDGHVELIGPKTVPLIAGSCAFYLKSAGTSGNAKITLTHASLPAVTFEVQVTKVEGNSND